MSKNRDLDAEKKGYKKAIYYANWKNLTSDIKKMGFSTSFKKIAGIMAIYVAAAGAVAFFMKLPVFCFVYMLILGIFIIPLLIVNMYRKIYEDNRFREVSQYIEQMLYSFKNTNKVYKSLQDIQPMFTDSPMGTVIEKAAKDIIDKGLEEGLKNFTDAYDCQKIQQLNKFLIEVEQVGGAHEDSIDLLLQDRETWVNRTLEYKKERNHRKVTVYMAIVVSFILCVLMEKILPREIDISSNPLCYLSSTILFTIDLVLFYITDNLCSASILNSLKTRADADIKKYYEYLVNYNAKREFLKGARVAPIGLLITVLGIVMNEIALILTGIFFAVYCLFKSRVEYNTRYKAIKEEIEIQFPRWLMNVALYIQSNSVQVALYKSIATAPLVLQPELIKLNNAIRENPTAPEPYLNFMKDFNMPDITMNMKMFYSIASGAGADVQKQVNEIIKRNNALLDKTERIVIDNYLAKMYMFFLAPQLTGGLKLAVDMVLFFIVFMSSSMVIA